MSTQKLENLSQTLLVLQSTYQMVECGLIHDNQLSTTTVAKEKASALLLPTIDTLLECHSIPLEQIGCIIVNQGPGPFTTLRTVIATANGIAMATGIPLISINGMQAFLDEYYENSSLPTVALLNAFHEAVYYGIKKDENQYDIDYMNIDNLLPILHQQHPGNVIRFIGNGTQLYKEKIVAYFQDQAYIPEPLPQYVSIQQIANIGKKLWEKQSDLTNQITPLYLKKPVQ